MKDLPNYHYVIGFINTKKEKTDKGLLFQKKRLRQLITWVINEINSRSWVIGEVGCCCPRPTSIPITGSYIITIHTLRNSHMTIKASSLNIGRKCYNRRDVRFRGNGPTISSGLR